MARCLLFFLPLVIAGWDEEKLFFSKSREGPRVSRHSLFRIDFKLGYKLKLFCEAEGHPRPIINWYKEGKEISPDSRTTIFEELYSSTMVSRIQIQLTRMGDAGEYECVAHNHLGAHVKKFKINYTLR